MTANWPTRSGLYFIDVRPPHGAPLYRGLALAGDHDAAGNVILIDSEGSSWGRDQVDSFGLELFECVACDAISCELTDGLLEMPELDDTDAAIVGISRWLDEHPEAVGVSA